MHKQIHTHTKKIKIFLHETLNLGHFVSLHFQSDAKCRRGTPYDKANLLRAYEATQSGMSVYRAARTYSVPESTLRDRTRCNVALDATPGPETILSWEEEKHLVEHIKYMGDIGYGYTKSNVQHMATDYCKSMGKSVISEKGLSSMWFYAFMKRWPDLKLAKPQKLQMSRAKSASREAIDSYFHELGTVLQQNNLLESPERIFNIDETGISMEHAPPKIVCASSSNPQAVTSARSSNVTIIAGANAIGNNIPPFYVFPGKRWNDEFLNGAPAGSTGSMSETGWSNSGIFERYVTEHLAKHANINENNNQCTLILYDGHKSHLSLTLTEWARQRHVVLFVLPPHSSHLTQPLDVGVFGPFKCQYNQECQIYMQKNPGVSITKYEVAQLTAKPYLKALSPENIISAFRKSGVYPFNAGVITTSQVAPSTIYINEENPAPSDKPESNKDCPKATSENSVPSITQSLTNDLPPETPNPVNDMTEKMKNFFSDRQITKVVQRPKKKFVPPYSVTGDLLKKSNIDSLTNQAMKKEQPKVQQPKVKKPTSKGQSQKVNKVSTLKLNPNTEKPSTSGQNKKGNPIELTSDISSESEISGSEDDNCCVCNRFQPAELQNCHQLVITKWAQCDFCPHWTHLKYCSEVTVIRRDSVFRCPHCLSKN